ncbi:DUF29 domain-containing protein [Leptolyngbya sp. NK1-12]|uniref:DUF29 domain-containing protein n=1 Tax=Leptolyngbya sp. NK1-12 TaxID=2547451 RepID=A0AA96WIB6_9CYAN|nr:DUF29 domain-containing protein [Leptolyngbya sp. NK1-12]WNZ25669.1 DUF29 domain-containing protein [Leptolyngbya sp. NK1-12]
MTSHNTDFHAWTQEQAKLLRTGQFHKLDLENLAEEIESLGRQERRELRNRLSVLVGHLLKWQFQPTGQGASWRATIKAQRREINRLIQENPSLKPYLTEAVADSYDEALALAIRETGLEQFPELCPYSVAQITDEEFLP